VRVTLYDASNEQRTGMPLAAVPRAEVEVQSDWLVADVLQAGGFGDSNSFALATDQIQADVAAGEDAPSTPASTSLESMSRALSDSQVELALAGLNSFAHVRRGYMRATRHALWSIPTGSPAASRQTDLGGGPMAI
jgi:hypothetical protein